MLTQTGPRERWKLTSLAWPRPELCSALDPQAAPRLAQLHAALQRFYNGASARAYFAMAESENDTWEPGWTAHWHLKDAIPSDATVLDLGCGSAHMCRHIHDRRPRYTGVDWAREQIARNRARYPEAEFVASSLYEVDLGERRFDVVMAHYVVEHLVWPHRLLDQMYARTAPGGLMAILTPPFRHRTYLKSFPYGLTSGPFGGKLRRLALVDALLHLYHHRLTYPLFLRTHYPRGHERSRFLIHMNPVCLEGGPIFPDADAVYLADTRELAEFLAALGATVVAHWPRAGYLLMRKNT